MSLLLESLAEDGISHRSEKRERQYEIGQQAVQELIQIQVIE